MNEIEKSTYVYISYSHEDKQIVRSLKDRLKKEGLQVFDDAEVMPGIEWNSFFKEQLMKADVFIPVFSNHYNQSAYTLRELQLALFVQETYNKLQIIPYLIGDVEDIPFDVRDRLCLRATDNQQYDFKKIIEAILQYADRRIVLEKEEKENKEKIEKSFDEYLNNVFERLDNNRKYYRNIGIVAYVMSGLFLSIAVIVSFHMSSQRIKNIETAILVFGSCVVLTCILAALSRMMFILGRSFMVESIRNADRYHAISFGKFYMQAFGNNISRKEIRDVLRSWDFDSDTNFIKQDAKEIDPNIMSIVENVIPSSK